MLNENLEERVVELVNQIELLNINQQYLDELKNSMGKENGMLNQEDSSIFLHRKDMALKVYQLLMNIDINSSIFLEVVGEMVEKESLPAFMEKVRFYDKQIQLLPTG